MKVKKNRSERSTVIACTSHFFMKEKWMKDLESHLAYTLTQEQVAIIQDQAPLVQVIATAGSGKTSTIVAKIGYMIGVLGIDPRHILALSYSRASAKDLKKRHQTMLPMCPLPTYSTLHAFAYMMIKRYDPVNGNKQVVEGRGGPSKYDMMLKQMNRSGGKFVTKEQVDDVFSAISYVKNALISPHQHGEGIEGFVDLYTAYHDWKNHHGLIDFDDMVALAHDLLSHQPQLLNKVNALYPYVLLDEAQDVNHLQVSLLNLITQKASQVVAIGDDDQSIYGFRAADHEYMLDLVKKHPLATSRHLSLNYRCPKNVVEGAKALIGQNVLRLEKSMQAARLDQANIRTMTFTSLEKSYEKAIELAKDIVDTQMGSVAVLVRNNTCLPALVHLGHKQGMALNIKEVQDQVYNHWVTKDLLTLMALSENRMDLPLYLRMLSKIGVYLPKDLKKDLSVNHHKGSAVDVIKQKVKGKLRTRFLDTVYDLEAIRSLPAHLKIDRILNQLGYFTYLVDRAQKGGYGQGLPLSVVASVKVVLEDVITYDQVVARIEHNRQAMQALTGQKASGRVHVSTIHGAKGLEYDHVIMVDLRDDLVPTYTSHSKPELLEEERRLFYVGVTRTRMSLTLIHPVVNYSRFIDEFNQKPWSKQDPIPKPFMASGGQTKVHPAFKESGQFILRRDQILKDMVLVHQQFGPGRVKQVGASNLQLEFNDGVKTLSLDLVLERRLLKTQ